jgi:pimeloyl-ACP methyl ester carboxylesterase
MLERAGHRVLTPDLLGMVAGQQPVIEQPLQTWADQVADIVAAQDAPVILVGHSRAGLIISEVAERVPRNIGLLVYLCAFLLQDARP